MDIFLKRVTAPQEKRQAGSTGSILEEGIVVIGADSSMCVIALEDLSGGQDVAVEDSDIADPGLV